MLMSIESQLFTLCMSKCTKKKQGETQCYIFTLFLDDSRMHLLWIAAIRLVNLQKFILCAEIDCAAWTFKKFPAPGGALKLRGWGFCPKRDRGQNRTKEIDLLPIAVVCTHALVGVSGPRGQFRQKRSCCLILQMFACTALAFLATRKVRTG